MRKCLVWALALAIAPVVAGAQSVDLQSKVPGCTVPDQFPVILSSVTGDVLIVRVYFHSDAGQTFFYVVATKTPEGWVAKLPKPKAPPTGSIAVYVEAIAKNRETSRTADYTIRVERSCSEKPVAATPAGGITVLGGAGTPMVGFSVAGVTSTLGGIAGVSGTILGMGPTTALIVGTGVIGAGTAGLLSATGGTTSPQ